MKIVNATPGCCSEDCQTTWRADYAEEISGAGDLVDEIIRDARVCLNCQKPLPNPTVDYRYLIVKEDTPEHHVRFGGFLTEFVAEDARGRLVRLALTPFVDGASMACPAYGNLVTLSQCLELRDWTLYDSMEAAHAAASQLS